MFFSAEDQVEASNHTQSLAVSIECAARGRNSGDGLPSNSSPSHRKSCSHHVKHLPETGGEQMHLAEWSSSMTIEGLEFDNVAVSVTDLTKSLEWYQRVFGFEVVYRTFSTVVDAELVIIERGAARIELLAQRGAREHPDAPIVPGPHLQTSGLKAIVFRTDDLEGITAYLETCSVQFEWKIQTLSADGLRSTMVRDPDGVLINVLDYPTTSPAFRAVSALPFEP